MEKKFRLRQNEDFKLVYREGKKYWNRNLILYKRKNGLDHSRIGFSINKKFGNREKNRLNLDDIIKGYDIIIIPRKNIIEIKHEELNSAMLHIFKISHLIRR